MDSAYRQVVETCGAFLLNRAKIEVTGSDAPSFLHRLITNDVLGLAQGEGCYACLCSNKGKILADFYCYRIKNGCLLDVATALSGKVISLLKNYLILENVSIADVSSEWGTLSWVGPAASEILKRHFKKIPTSNLEVVMEPETWLIKKPLGTLEGYEIWSRPEALQRLSDRFQVAQVTRDLQEMFRIEACVPRYGVDMDETYIPQEANLYNALSFTKGCYIGQETITRLEYRGHVNKQLSLMKLSGRQAPEPLTKITTLENEEAGFVTSACVSVKYGAPIAMGYLKYVYRDGDEFSVGDQKATRIRLSAK